MRKSAQQYREQSDNSLLIVEGEEQGCREAVDWLYSTALLYAVCRFCAFAAHLKLA